MHTSPENSPKTRWVSSPNFLLHYIDCAVIYILEIFLGKKKTSISQKYFQHFRSASVDFPQHAFAVTCLPA